MEDNKQQATSLDVERQPRPVGGGTTGSGRDRRRRALTEEELARYAVERRRQYMFSLAATILIPIMTLGLFVTPFLVTSWHRQVRITWWLAALFGVYASFYFIRFHDKNYGYHPEIPFCPPNPATDHC